MKITKCDRCGCEISPKKCKSTNVFDAISEVLYSINHKEIKYSITKYIDDMLPQDIDLCEDCTNKFKDWMNPEVIKNDKVN